MGGLLELYIGNNVSKRLETKMDVISALNICMLLSNLEDKAQGYIHDVIFDVLALIRIG